MVNDNLIIAPGIPGKNTASWTEQDFKLAIKKFRQNAPTAPLPRLYEAYKWLKEHIDIHDNESDKQFTYFIEHFLQILEKRGAGNSEIYSEVLRDSAEYKYLKELFHSSKEEDKEPEPETIIQKAEHPVLKEKKITLKSILRQKNPSLSVYDINSWNKLVNEHLRSFATEESFVKNCSSIISNINKTPDKEPFHLEIVIVYALEMIQLYKKPSLKTKDFALKLLNLMTNKMEIWTVLHKEYLEIIKK